MLCELMELIKCAMISSNQMDLMKNLNTMIGTMVELNKEILSELKDMNSKTAIAPEKEGEVMATDDENEDDENLDEEEQKALMLDRREKMLDNFNERLNKLMV